MKKPVCAALLFLTLAACMLFGGCSDSNAKESAATPSDAVRGTGKTADSAALNTVDVDLTVMSSTMVYAEVYNMTSAPEEYIGKRVKMKGSFASAPGDGRYYFACIIADATACCSQGIEFFLKDDLEYPDEYPEEGAEITVTGIFGTYAEGPNIYCQLTDAELG